MGCNEDPVQHVWESSADASFTVVDDPRGNTLGRGTRVTLHLKEDAHDYLSEDKLKDSVKKYSQFIQFPIYVKVKKEVEAEAEEEEDDDKDDESEEKKAPFDMMDNYWQKKSEVKLFVRRVLVAEKFDELLPRYLNFVRGVVDSDDLPLNVSREQLQQNKIMKVISKKLVRKVLELMKKLAKEEESGEDEEEEEDEEGEKKEDEEKKEEKKDKADEEGTWSKFWKEFNKNLKMGCYEDASNRSKLSKLLRFATTKSEGKEISLDKY